MSPEKALYHRFLDALRQRKGWDAATEDFFAPDAAIHIVHPWNALRGGGGYRTFLAELEQSLTGLHRRDHIAFSGMFEGGTWVTSTGYWAGRFIHPLRGIAPTGELAWLRVGEFHRIEGDRAVESYVFLDLPELMIAAGLWPIAEHPGATRGYTGMLPGPATGDGMLWDTDAPQRGAEAAEIVTKMLRGLNTPDQAWRPHWDTNMMWYGPAAFGSFIGVEAFGDFQVPFEASFEGWSGGAADNGLTAHFTRFGDGDYVCSGGWPSLTGVHVKPFLGCDPTSERVFMRVCDWWRLEGPLCVENWVFVDIPHVLLQLGRDVLAEASG